MPYKDDTPPLLKKTVHKIERYIIKSLIAMMSILLIIATIELGYVLVKSVLESDSDHFIINLDNLMNVFGVFLLVVIGIELLDTIKVYFREHVIHVEVVLLVAIIALARKVIVVDFEKYTGLQILGLAAVLLALSGGYYLIKKTGGCGFWPKETDETEDILIEERISKDDDSVLERRKTIKKKSEENLIAPGSHTQPDPIMKNQPDREKSPNSSRDSEKEE